MRGVRGFEVPGFRRWRGLVPDTEPGLRRSRGPGFPARYPARESGIGNRESGKKCPGLTFEVQDFTTNHKSKIVDRKCSWFLVSRSWYDVTNSANPQRLRASRGSPTRDNWEEPGSRLNVELRTAKANDELEVQNRNAKCKLNQEPGTRNRQPETLPPFQQLQKFACHEHARPIRRPPDQLQVSRHQHRP